MESHEVVREVVHDALRYPPPLEASTMAMMSDEIERGKQVFIRIVHELAPAVVVSFEDAGHGRYRVLFLGRRPTSRVVPEEDLADLANNGGVKAGIRQQIREALEEIGELGRA